jgi:hypothetical protein
MNEHERSFRAKYPNARCIETKSSLPGGLSTFTVYAGDYLCAESWGRGRAFMMASQYERDGLITPDPNEVQMSLVEL